MDLLSVFGLDQIREAAARHLGKFRMNKIEHISGMGYPILFYETQSSFARMNNE